MPEPTSFHQQEYMTEETPEEILSENGEKEVTPAEQRAEHIRKNLQINAERMVQRSLNKGRTNYQYKVGDLVLVLKELNKKNTLIRKKNTLHVKYLEDAASIVEILHNRRYRLQLPNGSSPHNKATFTSSQFVLYEKKGTEDVQQITTHDIVITQDEQTTEQDKEEESEDENNEQPRVPAQQSTRELQQPGLPIQTRKRKQQSSEPTTINKQTKTSESRRFCEAGLYSVWTFQ